MVKRFLRYSHLNNRAIWLAESISVSNPRTRFFPDMSLQRMIENHNRFDFRKLWTNISWLNFLLKCKNFIFGPFLPKIGKTRIFLKNRALSLFNPYWPLTSCKKSEKSYDSIPRKSRPDGRKDGRHWIHKTSLSWVQKQPIKA